MIDKINDLHIKDLKEQFKQYLNDNYSHLKDKGIVFSDAFYPYRHDIGIEFWDVFIDEDSLKKARQLLEIRFTNEKSHKDPKRNSYGYMRTFKIFKRFLDNTYGGVAEYLEYALANNPKEPEYVPIKRETTNKIKKKEARPDIPRPCSDEVAKYLLSWEQLENYALQESALDKLFYRTYPLNTDIDDVLIKVSSLNDFYSTNIFSPFQVAKHIINLDIDDRLQAGDVTLVNDIAKVTMDNGKVKKFYSFATKYCSHHKPIDFPIYDSYVDKLLRYFRDVDGFYKFSNDDLKNYVKFKNILLNFGRFYSLTPYNLKEIDKYLWQLGKEKFPKRY
jgi:hypothetical protein